MTLGYGEPSYRQATSLCYDFAKQQTGIDPQAPPPPAKTAEQKAAEQKAAADNAQAPKGGRARGAARGASACAIVGAIAGDAGTGGLQPVRPWAQ